MPWRGAHKKNFIIARLAITSEFILASAVFHSPVRWLICVYFSKFTLARLPSDFKFRPANENSRSPWRYDDAYVHAALWCSVHAHVALQKSVKKTTRQNRGKSETKTVVSLNDFCRSMGAWKLMVRYLCSTIWALTKLCQRNMMDNTLT